MNEAALLYGAFQARPGSIQLYNGRSLSLGSEYVKRFQAILPPKGFMPKPYGEECTNRCNAHAICVFFQPADMSPKEQFYLGILLSSPHH